MGQRYNLSVGETGVGEMGVSETGQIIGETGVGETGVGEMGVIRFMTSGQWTVKMYYMLNGY